MKWTIILSILVALMIPANVSALVYKTIPVGFGCDTTLGACECAAELVSLQVQPYATEGDRVTVYATLKLGAGGLDKCRFYLESAIIPPSSTFSILTANRPICCPQNTNYAATYYEIDNTGNPLSTKEEEVVVEFSMYAPKEGSVDACNPGNPSYWIGPGQYDVTITATNGCAKELGSNYVNYFWTRYTKITLRPKSCDFSGCQEPYDREWCPEQCQDVPNPPPKPPVEGYVCTVENCQGPLYHCVGNSCQPDYMALGVILLLAGIVVYIYKRKE